MKTIVVASHFYTDPERYCFHSAQDANAYERLGINPSYPKLIGTIITGLTIRWRLLSGNTDLVILEEPRAGMGICLLLRLTGAQVPIVIWNFNILRVYAGLRRRIAQLALKWANAVVVYSRHERSRYAAHFGVSESKFRFKLLSGPFLEDLRFVAVRTGAEKQDYVVCPGYSGRNFRLLAQVAAQIPSIKFIVLAYPKAIGDVQLPPNIQLQHSISEIEYCRIIADARLCFLPIANLGTANGHLAIVQAMGLKTLLLTNVTPGTSDYLRDGENCVLFCGKNAKEIATVLLSVYTSAEEYSSVVEQAFMFAATNFCVKSDVAMIQSVRRDRCECASAEGVSLNAPLDM